MKQFFFYRHYIATKFKQQQKNMFVNKLNISKNYGFKVSTIKSITIPHAFYNSCFPPSNVRPSIFGQPIFLFNELDHSYYNLAFILRPQWNFMVIDFSVSMKRDSPISLCLVY